MVIFRIQPIFRAGSCPKKKLNQSVLLFFHVAIIFPLRVAGDSWINPSIFGRRLLLFLLILV